jgi:hypothetical protein
MPARPDPLAAPLPVASERVYADKDGNLVKADNPDRVTLVAAAGVQVPEQYRGAYETFAGQASEPAPAAPENAEVQERAAARAEREAQMPELRTERLEEKRAEKSAAGRK